MLLALDTSAYTTSLATLVSNERHGIKLQSDHRCLLEVPTDKRGLRQSEAVFQHLHNMPQLFDKVDLSQVTAVAVSTRPRPIESSYMPVFHVGLAFASSVANGLGIPLVEVSHQEGHLAAAMWAIDFWPEYPFLALHISGGTTDVLHVKIVKGQRLCLAPLGTSTDIHAGQFVDRVGIALGASFPAGKTMDLWATQAQHNSPGLSISSSVKAIDMSFSGPATAAHKLIDNGANKNEIAWAVFRCIANSIEKAVRNALSLYPVNDLLVVGGVASNSHIRSRLNLRLPLNIHFAQPKYCTDNAVGVGVLALKDFNSRRF